MMQHRDWYSAILARSEPLDVAREGDLARAYRAGDVEAGHALVAANVRYAAMVARRFGRTSGPDYDDLIQQANIGMVHALERFDPDVGVRFISYAYPWITKSIMVYLDRTKLVRAPLGGEARVVAIAYRKHAPTTPEALAAIAGVTEKRARTLWPALAGERVPLDDVERDRDDDGDPFMRARLAEALTSELDERGRDVLFRRVVLGESLGEIGALHNLSGERIRQIENESLAALRAYFQRYQEAA